MQCGCELVDLFEGRVDIEARPGRCGNTQFLMKRHRTMMPGANRDALFVQDFCDVVGMDSPNVKDAKPPCKLPGGPSNDKPGTSLKDSKAY